MALLVIAGMLLLWFVQGVGLVQWLAPELRRDSVVGWVLAVWCGLLANVVVAVNLYLLLPVTIGQIAWPVTLGLIGISAIGYVKSPRPTLRIDATGGVVLALSGFATVLAIRPLVAHADLGFYFFDYAMNGELANYAAIADLVQFHDSTTSVRDMIVALTSRESTVGALCAIAATLTGKATAWVTQPVVIAFASLAFASLGLLFRRIVAIHRLGRIASLVIAAIYGWAILSASAQYFWMQAFASQFLSIALFFGGLVLHGETRELAPRRRMLIFGVLLGGLLYAYPEMFVPTVGMLCIYDLASADDRRRAALRWFAIVVIGLVVTNRFAFDWLSRLGSVGGAGWNVHGDHHPIGTFLSNIYGFANPILGANVRSAAWPFAASVAFALAAIHAIQRTRNAQPELRALSWLYLTFLVGVALMFWLVVKRGTGLNYPAIKFILGFQWLGYLALAGLSAHAMQWRWQLVAPIAVLTIGVWIGLYKPALNFTKQLHRAEKDMLYLESEADACRAQIGGGHVYVSANWYHFAIIGQFLANDRDVSADGWWPGAEHPMITSEPVLLVKGRDHELAKDPKIRAPYRERCRGQAFVVYVRE